MDYVTIILIIILVVVFTAMLIAIFRFLKMVNETKANADAMSEEERLSYAPNEEEES